MTVIIAEIGLNHDGNLNYAKALVDEAFAAGADVVKFQLRFPEYDTLPTEWRVQPTEGSYRNKTRAEYWKATTLDENALAYLGHYIRSTYGLTQNPLCDKATFRYCFSTFSRAGLQRAKNLFVFPFAYKVASGEVFKYPYDLVPAEAPILVSGGLVPYREMADFLFENVKHKNIIPLQCVSQYPQKFLDFKEMDDMQHNAQFGFRAGMSLHTPYTEAAMAAITHGADVVEVHFTLSRKLPLPDAPVSLLPHELKTVCDFRDNFAHWTSEASLKAKKEWFEGLERQRMRDQFLKHD